ncbi:MAG: trigger factor [Clostridiales bacterium]|jgi:trigger factor|nr:trigger factor [Clostridiales bacterium]
MASSSIEEIDRYKVKLTFNINPQSFAEGLKSSYNMNKKYFTVHGFRPGKAPRKLIEKMYGSDVFYQDAIESVAPHAYKESVEEHDLFIVSKPDFHLQSVSETEGAVITAELNIIPPPVLGEYKGLTYAPLDTEISDEEIEKAINVDREKNARIFTLDRPVENGDVVKIDFTGYINDEVFEGGSGEDYELTIGSGTFIPGFEEQLIGVEPGESIFVRVTFPEDYHVEEFRGKPASFDVKINEVQAKELPEPDDDFAQDVSDFETFEEYRNDIINNLKNSKDKEADDSMAQQVLSKLVDNAAIEVPEFLIQEEIGFQIEQLRSRFEQTGFTLEDFLEQTNSDLQKLKENYREGALRRVKQRIALETIAKLEDFEPTDEEIHDRMHLMALIYDTDISRIDRDVLVKELKTEFARQFVLDNAVEDDAVEFVIEDSDVINDDITELAENTVEEN